MDERLNKLKLGELEVYRTLYRIFEEHPRGLSLVDLSMRLNERGVIPAKNITQWLRKHAEKIGLKIASRLKSRTLDAHGPSKNCLHEDRCLAG